MRVYQPLNGLHDAIVIDATHPNFADLALTVRCRSGDLSFEANTALCRNVEQLFESQGASVTTLLDTLSIAQDFAGGEGRSEAPQVPPSTDLVVEIESRLVKQRVPPVSWVLCVASLTVLPGVVDETFAQEVTVRDGNGFLLVRETLEGRLVTRFGFGPWLFNRIVDLGREREDRFTSANLRREVSEDFYGRLSQLVFNAKLQWRVLQESAVSQGAP